MKWARYLVVVLIAAAFVSTAIAAKPPGNPGNSGASGSQGQAGTSGSSGTSTTPGKSAAHRSSTTALPGPGATLATKAKAYGDYCQNQSKLHTAGQTGTPFSQCLTAMAKLATGQTKDAWTACHALSRKHLPGQTGSPFSRCVVAGTRLLNDLRKP